MIDFMLRTDTEAQMDAALEAAGLIGELNDPTTAETVMLPIAGVYIDRIGVIPPQLDPDGKMTFAGDSRYHVNLRVTIDLTAAQVAVLPTFMPTPTLPYRVWA